MRCNWADHSELEREWHDNEWGKVVRDDRALFELLTLRGAQAGLAWRTVLGKRDAYRRVFHDYDIERIAGMDDDEMAEASCDRGIIRHKLKVASVRTNARIVRGMSAKGGSLGELLWSFTGGQPVINSHAMQGDVPMRSDISDAMSFDLKRRGFQFAGTAICYALMQSAGIVNDHLVTCDCHPGAIR